MSSGRGDNKIDEGVTVMAYMDGCDMYMSKEVWG